MTTQTQTALESTAAAKQWKAMGVTHHHGINVSLASLHSAESCGIGEYLDLIPMIDWCSEVGFDVIQLLPLNDTGHDPSPYNALSAVALHPVYLSLSQLPHLDQHEDLQQALKKLATPTSSPRFAYQAVRRNKERWFGKYCQRELETYQDNEAFQTFVSDNPWLQGYALFKVLKRKNEWKTWKKWPKGLQNPTAELIEELLCLCSQEVDLHYLEQFLCAQQLHYVKEYAESKGVLLKGDIPILISPDSADVWLERELFSMRLCAGAPPDAYATQGQNWGFPLYHWDVLEKEDYRWWKMRLDAASSFYHLYRLDHIVGFFRIWAVSPRRSGKTGIFIPEDPSTWIAHGEKILRMMLHHCPMLPIGEDLGTVPDEVRACLQRLGICGTKVMRWERRWHEDSAFIPFEEYPPESMTTVSTHDSRTLQQWWKEKPDEAQTFAAFKGWEYHAPLTLEQRRVLLKDSHHTASLFHINLLQEYLALAPYLVWPAVEDERINVPGTLSKNNWTYRLRPSVEEIAANDYIKDQIQQILL